MKSRIIFTFFSCIGFTIGSLLANNDISAPIAFGGLFGYVASMFFMPNKEPKQ